MADNCSDCSTGTANVSSDGYEEFLEVSQFVNGLVLYPVICFPGLVANILTLVILSQKNMRTSTNVFLSALAVSDSVKLMNDIMYFVVIVLVKTNPPAANVAYGYLYPYAHFIFNMSACVSSWLTVSVAVERFILVCYATRAKLIISRQKSLYTCICIYVVMTAIALPSAFRYRTIHVVDAATNNTMLEVELTELWKDETFVRIYIWIQNCIRSIVPLLVLIVLNSRIIQTLSKTRSVKKSRQNMAKNRVTITMIVIILVFMMCITPDVIMSTFFGIGYHEADNLAKGIREYTDTLLALNSAINFVIYCALNTIFRKTFTKIFCGAHGRVKSDLEMEESRAPKKVILCKNGIGPKHTNYEPVKKFGSTNNQEQEYGDVESSSTCTQETT